MCEAKAKMNSQFQLYPDTPVPYIQFNRESLEDVRMEQRTCYNRRLLTVRFSEEQAHLSWCVSLWLPHCQKASREMYFSDQARAKQLYDRIVGFIEGHSLSD